MNKSATNKSAAMMLFIITAALAFTAPLGAQDSFIREMTGTVEMKKPGSEEWVPASAGDQIEKNAMISTGFRSTATLEVGSSTIVVQALTRMSLEELIRANQTETVNINLSSGRIRVDVNPPTGGRADFLVQTPAVTASVRGTSFEMDTDSIRVTHGAVRYVPAAETRLRPVTVSAGGSSWVDADTGAAVMPMAAAEKGGSLPPLPGQSARSGISAAGVLPEIPGGTLDVNVTLVEK